MASVDNGKITSELRGNTLRVYWVLLKMKEGVIGVRELQRQLGLSSPSLAAYHLNKLVELGLVVKERGDYRLVRAVKVGVLKQFTKFGTLLLPRYAFYAALFTTLLVFFVTQLKEVNFYSVFALLFGVLGTTILWYETIRVWKEKP